MSSTQPTRRELLRSAGALALGAPFVSGRDGAPLVAPRAGRDETREVSARPNVLFLIDDQHRWDVLGCAGDPLARTPHLDRLAGQGTRFTDVYCQVPLCVPARESLNRGQHAHEHGTFGNVVGDFPGGRPSLAAHFRAQGYQCAMIGKSHFDDSDFETVVEKGAMFRDFAERHPGAQHPGADAIEHGTDAFPKSLRTANPNFAPAAHDPETPVFYMEPEVVRQCERFLDERDRERPFFLWASLVNPHPPRFLPEDAMAEWRERDVPLPKPLTQQSYGALFEYLKSQHHASGMSRVDLEQMRNLVRAYYATIEWSDQHLGALLAMLDERRLGRDTLVVYTSDHGEALGEHGQIGKVNFFEGPERVPLMLRWPGRIEAGRVVPRVVTHLDLVASLPALVGLPPMPGASGRDLSPLLGASVGAAPEGEGARADSPAGEGEAYRATDASDTADPKPSATERPSAGGPAADWEDVAIAELYLGGLNYEEVPGELLSVMLRRDRFKYMEGAPGEAALFDLVEDPKEERDLSTEPAHATLLADLREEARRHKPKSFFARVTKRRGKR